MRQPEPTKPGDMTKWQAEQVRTRRIPRGKRRNMAREFRRGYPRSERKGVTIGWVERNGPQDEDWKASDLRA